MGYLFAVVACLGRRFQNGAMPLRRFTSSRSADAKSASTARASFARSDTAHTAPEKMVSMAISARQVPNHLEYRRRSPFAALLKPSAASPLANHCRDRDASRGLPKFRLYIAEDSPALSNSASSDVPPDRWSSQLSPPAEQPDARLLQSKYWRRRAGLTATATWERTRFT